jgi:hypothetical protein
VYESERAATAAAQAAGRAGAFAGAIRVGAALDRVASLKGEMREETDHTTGGPGVGPFTKEMSEGMSFGVLVGALVGAIVALPFSAFGFAGWSLGPRVIIVAIVGVAAGGTVGWIVGGAFGARRPDESLAAERGVTVTAPALASVLDALVAAGPIRIDVVDADGGVVGAASTEQGAGLVREIARHMGEEQG